MHPILIFVLLIFGFCLFLAVGDIIAAEIEAWWNLRKRDRLKWD